MNIILLPLLMLTPALSVDDAPRDAAVLQEPAKQAKGEQKSICRDSKHLAREESGKPAKDVEIVSADDPLFIAAVGYSVDGCSVMVMRNDTSDLRPIPVPATDQPLLMPAN